MTEPQRQSGAVWAVAVGVGIGAAYWALLGWDQHKDTDPVTGAQSGPYQPWQVLGLAALVGLFAFLAGRAGRPWSAAAIPVVLTCSFAIDAGTDADADGLWPVGALLVALGSTLGAGVAAAFGARFGRNRG